MSGLNDGTTGLSEGTGLTWTQGLSGGVGLSGAAGSPTLGGGKSTLLKEDNTYAFLLEDGVSVILLEV